MLLSWLVWRVLVREKIPQLRVLMYHKVSGNGDRDGLTVPANSLEAQFNYLLKQGYTPLLLSDLLNYTRTQTPLPQRPVLITFDDGYRDNFTVMYPLLKKYGMKANIFLVPAFLQPEQAHDHANNEYLQLSDIQAMDQQLVEYGLHSYDHKSYKKLTPDEINQDIIATKRLLQSMDISYQPCLAFPYGAFPKRNPVKRLQFYKTLAANDIELAFRIGNRLNRLPLRNPLLIQRLDIRGDDPFEKFVSLLRKGKNKI
ncbi:polysaccharide deacetylase family protein [Niastella vici]|nr:polysaccharide deacetylase family protein [Niastella vici]